MKKLIEAFSIMLQYGEVSYPLSCEHDVLYVHTAVPFEDFSPEDIARLEELGFGENSDGGSGFMAHV